MESNGCEWRFRNIGHPFWIVDLRGHERDLVSARARAVPRGPVRVTLSGNQDRVAASRYAGGSASVLPEPAAGGSVTPGTRQARL